MWSRKHNTRIHWAWDNRKWDNQTSACWCRIQSKAFQLIECVIYIIHLKSELSNLQIQMAIFKLIHSHIFMSRWRWFKQKNQIESQYGRGVGWPSSPNTYKIWTCSHFIWSLCEINNGNSKKLLFETYSVCYWFIESKSKVSIQRNQVSRTALG